MLYLNRHKIDWATGKIERQETIFLHDPDKKVPFRIVHEDTAKRYLTGADFDTEGFQIIGDTFWIGDEFGPYVLKADRSGKVLAVFETTADGKPVRSPDHWSVQSPGAPGAELHQRQPPPLQGLRGLRLVEGRQVPVRPARRAVVGRREEGLGKGRRQGSLADPRIRRRGGKIHRRATGSMCSRQNGNAIGDFNMIDATSGLIIERDNGEGTADKACPQGTRGENCFPDLAKFKRVYKIELVGRQRRQAGAQDRLYRPDEDQGSRQEGTQAAQ